MCMSLQYVNLEATQLIGTLDIDEKYSFVFTVTHARKSDENGLRLTGSITCEIGKSTQKPYDKSIDKVNSYNLLIIPLCTT